MLFPCHRHRKVLGETELPQGLTRFHTTNLARLTDRKMPNFHLHALLCRQDVGAAASAGMTAERVARAPHSQIRFSNSETGMIHRPRCLVGVGAAVISLPS